MPPRILTQMNLLFASLDFQIPQDHPARIVWQFIDSLDLSDFIEPIYTLKDGPGRPAVEPKILLALWIYGITEGIVSARQIAKYSKEH